MKKRTTKQIFAETFLEMAKTTPIDRIKVTDLVKQSGCSMQSFYNSFDNKQDLLVWIYGSRVEDLVNRIGSNGYTFEDYLSDTVEGLSDYEGYIRNALKNTTGKEFFFLKMSERVCEVWRENICRRFELETLPEEIDFMLRFSVFGVMHINMLKMLDKEPIQKDKIINLSVRSIPDKLRPYILA